MLFSKSENILWLNGDELDVQTLFENISAARLKTIYGTKKIVIIDEAQRIENIGWSHIASSQTCIWYSKFQILCSRRWHERNS